MFEGERKFLESRAGALLLRLQELFYEDERPLEAEYAVFEPGVGWSGRLNGDYRPITVGTAWGNDWKKAWFHLSGRVPEVWKGKRVCARIHLGGEGLIFDTKGVPVQSLTVHNIWGPDKEIIRDRFDLFSKARGGESVDIWIEASAGQLFGLPLNPDRGNTVPDRFGQYEAVVRDLTFAMFRRDIWELYLDTMVLAELMKILPQKNVRRKRILYALNRMIDAFTGDPENVALSREMLKGELSRKSSSSDLSTTVVGHAHIDTAWLWPLSETVKKCGRTFANQLKLMEIYPEFVFGASQAQLYAFVKEYYPELFAKVKKRVASGQWEVQGGMWVEADCNLTAGESLVRQILYGKRFFKKEFGIDVRNLWLPDVFGYSAALPQILKKSGITSFVTQKLSWNQFNRFPHHTFIWRGIDGSEVVTHFPPEDDYNLQLKPSTLVWGRENFDESDRLDEFLTLYGIGDGGGGPTEEMVETGRRQKDLEGSPRVRFGKAQDFLDRLEKKKHLLPLWTGELYFEYHRGTYTTHGDIKKMNRTLELKLRALEILSSVLPFKKYPHEQIESMWKIVLLNQFHDIIPGSCITPVYELVLKQYSDVMERSGTLLERAGALFPEKKDTITVFNPLSFTYTRPVELPLSWSGFEVLDREGGPVCWQEEQDRPVFLGDIPPFSALILRKGPGKRRSIRGVSGGKDAFSTAVRSPKTGRDAGIVLENSRIQYRFSENGTLVQAYDKEQKWDVIPGGKAGNLLFLYEDRPVKFDAWDIDITYENQVREQAKLISLSRIADGPVRQSLEFVFDIGKSKIVQRVTLSSRSKCLDFETRVDWREDHKLLRVGFETDLHSDTATYEIQYGTIERNTHRNTSLDMAKFEVIGHRFADLSDEIRGAALLNDSKYGYKILGSLISLSLLRAISSPDPKADRGMHHFTYSFLPHQGRFVDSDVLSEALQLNQAPLCFDGRDGGGFQYPFVLEGDEVVLEVVKKAEEGDAHILRLYEPRGRRCSTSLFVRKSGVSVFLTDLLEDPKKEIPVKAGKVKLDFQPFEIKTLKIAATR